MFRVAASVIFALSCMLAMTGSAAAQSSAPDPLEAGFQNPPASARPRVWWHWMNGNVTEEGIRLIGDKQPGAEHHAFTTFDPYEATSPLLESGLLGPVNLNAVLSVPTGFGCHPGR